MIRGWDIPPDGDPGGGALTGGNMFDGSFRGRTIPKWMDPSGEGGELTVLQLQPVEPAKLPDNPGIVCVSVTSCCGKIEGAFPESRGTRYVLKVRKMDQVQKLKNMKTLTDGTPISIKEHPTHNFVKCVVHCPDVVKLSDQAVMDLLDGQRVAEIRRITKKGDGDKTIITPMMILTIKGTYAPQYVYFGFLRVKTRPYYPAPMQCYKCWEFGHTRLRCSKKDMCGTCCGEHVIIRGVFCHLPVKCNKCKTSEHPVSSRRCPFYVAENDIAKLKVDRGMSYDTAKRHYETLKSNAVQANKPETESDKKFEEFAQKMEDRINKQNEEMTTQKKDWERRFQDQQAELETQRKESDRYRNLYETTKTMLDQMKMQYFALLEKTGTDTRSNENLAHPISEKTDPTTKIIKKVPKKLPDVEQSKQRRSRSRSRGRELRPRQNNHSRDRSTKRSRTRGQSAKRSRSNDRRPQQQSCSSPPDNGNIPPKTKIQKQNSKPDKRSTPGIPIDLSGSSEDDSEMQQ